jgi:phospholipid/cholesterol/gamma-HCH transport system substrate-binding protein
METRAHFVVIGAFVLLVTLCGALFTMWLAQDSFRRSFATYEVAFQGPVRGLSEGGDVRFNGIKVGEVDRLTFDPGAPNTVVAVIRVNQTTPISPDSLVVLEFVGLTGLSFIQVQAGQQPSFVDNPPAEGVVPRLNARATQIDELVSSGGDVITGANETLAKLNLILTAENAENLRRTLANLRDTTGGLTGVGELVTDLRATLGRVETAVVEVEAAAKAWNSLGTEVEGQIGPLATETRAVLTEAGRTLAGLNTEVARVGGRVDRLLTELEAPTVEVLEEAQLAAADLRALSVRLEAIAREVERDPRAFFLGDVHPAARAPN